MGKGKESRNLESDLSLKNLRIEEIDSPVEIALILLCEKCGRKNSEKGKNFAFDLQKELKHSAAEHYGKRQIRTLTTSCFDICPKNRVAACVIPTGSSEKSHARFIELKCDSVERAADGLVHLVESMRSKRAPAPV